ncbi:MAG: alpha/beta hydrolase [Acidobacteria bacterium]|nr:alpha/beta hydrolase [Acidobacteriota bacterium]
MKAALLLTALLTGPVPGTQQDLYDRVEHGYVDNNGVKIHYAAIGTGPLVVMIHGFPDFWYSWREQMEALAGEYRLLAIDQRGYNLSDKPAGVESYAMPLLVSDVVAVIHSLGEEKAVVVGHDWGGMVAWQTAINAPEVVERLIILNLPHPRGLMRELAKDEEQAANSQYARNFQQEGAHQAFTAEALAGWVTDPVARARYVEAFERSDFEAMLHYYKANYPRPPYTEDNSPLVKVRCPVLVIHGLEDQYLLAGALDRTWEWIDNDLTLVTIPGAGHFVQQDATEMVNRSILAWLNR